MVEHHLAKVRVAGSNPVVRSIFRLHRFRFYLTAVLAVCLVSCGGAGGKSQMITVAAASDLRPAFNEIAIQFTKQTNIKVEFSFGSSGQLREQIINGAPFDVFASANSDYVDDVIKSGPGDMATRSVYAIGRLAVVTSNNLTLPSTLFDLQEARFRRIVIANPQHAPYGLAAQQTLRSLEIANVLENRLIFGENISDTLRIVQSGNADAALVALSLVIGGESKYLLVPANLHLPINQTLVVTAPAKTKDAAIQFADFIKSPTGLAIMSRYGFEQPEIASTVAP